MTSDEFQESIDASPPMVLKVDLDKFKLQLEQAPQANNTTTIFARSKSRSAHFEVCDAELGGALAGLKAAYDFSGTQPDAAHTFQFWQQRAIR